jgi:iron complex transport system substrate-binding protein
MRARSAVWSLALIALLAACGPGDQPSAESTGAAAAPRNVAHARGETAVPADPQRVVVLEPVQLDTAVALGKTPVGAAVLSEATGIPAYLGPEAAGIATVGTVAEPSIEKIAALDPDLILGTESRHSELYDQLSGIASTVFMASQADPWPDNVLFVGRTYGTEAQAQALLDGYRARCAEIADRFDTAGKTAQLIRPRNEQLTLYGPTSFAGSTLECAGFTIPPRDWQNSISVDLSPELVLEARADYVFVTTVDPSDRTTIPPSVAAVSAESFPQLHLVDQAFWITGVGPRGGMTVLDDIERILSS